MKLPRMGRVRCCVSKRILRRRVRVEEGLPRQYALSMQSSEWLLV